MKELSHLIPDIEEIERKLGYTFRDKNLLTLAFIHRSFVNENRDVCAEHNERLEFLGDSVLGILIAEYLYRNFPKTPEGDLSHLRARLVEAATCVRYVQLLGVEERLFLGKGEQRNDGRGRESILADLFEAIVGAIFLDGGFDAAQSFFFNHFAGTVRDTLSGPLRNWKTELQDHAQKVHHQAPVYEVVAETGPDHSKMFEIVVKINDEIMGRGKGHSKKEAQQAAAQEAWGRIEAER